MRTKRNDYYLKMETQMVPVPYYQHERRVRVLLPKDYDKEQWASYPVIYMHDGQNVFYSKESYSGYSWKVIPTMKYDKQLPKAIVVGIDNAGTQRLDEYGPWQTDSALNAAYAQAGGDGMQYATWLVETLKPFIDQHYRTKPEPHNTVLAGSSMGGFITAYIAAAYPQVFRALGIFSMSSWFSERDFLRFVSNHPLPHTTRVYIQVGTAEGDDTDTNFIEKNSNQRYLDCNLAYYQQLLRHNHPLERMWLRIIADETHHEKYWAKHFAEFLHFSFQEH